MSASLVAEDRHAIFPIDRCHAGCPGQWCATCDHLPCRRAGFPASSCWGLTCCATFTNPIKANQMSSPSQFLLVLHQTCSPLASASSLAFACHDHSQMEACLKQSMTHCGNTQSQAHCGSVHQIDSWCLLIGTSVNNELILFIVRCQQTVWQVRFVTLHVEAACGHNCLDSIVLVSMVKSHGETLFCEAACGHNFLDSIVLVSMMKPRGETLFWSPS